MKRELNDETLTAYALGELDAAEVKAVEKLLAEADKAGNAVPKAALGEIRSAIDVTQAAFSASASDASLSDEQREKLDTLAGETAARRSLHLGRWTALAAAAVLIIAAAVALPSFKRAREEAGPGKFLLSKKTDPANAAFSEIKP